MEARKKRRKYALCAIHMQEEQKPSSFYGDLMMLFTHPSPCWKGRRAQVTAPASIVEAPTFMSIPTKRPGWPGTGKVFVLDWQRFQPGDVPSMRERWMCRRHCISSRE